jgi:hypothetical protein
VKQLSAVLEEKKQAFERLERQLAAVLGRAAEAEDKSKRLAELVEAARAGLRDGAAVLETQCVDLESIIYAAALGVESVLARERDGAMRSLQLRAIVEGLETEIAAAERLPALCGARVAQAVR